MLKKDNIVWGNCTKGNSDLLKKVQIEAARIIKGVNSSKTFMYNELLKELT